MNEQSKGTLRLTSPLPEIRSGLQLVPVPKREVRIVYAVGEDGAFQQEEGGQWDKLLDWSGMLPTGPTVLHAASEPLPWRLIDFAVCVGAMAPSGIMSANGQQAGVAAIAAELCRIDAVELLTKLGHKDAFDATAGLVIP